MPSLLLLPIDGLLVPHRQIGAAACLSSALCVSLRTRGSASAASLSSTLSRQTWTVSTGSSPSRPRYRGSRAQFPMVLDAAPPADIAAEATAPAGGEKKEEVVSEEQVTGHIISTTIGGKNGEPKRAKCLETGETVAIKKVLQDQRYKNRELQLMHAMNHPNIICLKHCFFSTTARDDGQASIDLQLKQMLLLKNSCMHGDLISLKSNTMPMQEHRCSIKPLAPLHVYRNYFSTDMRSSVSLPRGKANTKGSKRKLNHFMLLAASPSTAITMCGSSLMAELSASPPSSCSASMTRLLDGLLIHSHLKKLPDLYALDWRERGREQLIEHVYGCTVKWRAMKFCAKVSEVEGS